MQRLEVSGVVRPIYGSLGVKRLSSSLCTLLRTPRPKYVPQHPILEHPQPMFLPQIKRPSFTPIAVTVQVKTSGRNSIVRNQRHKVNDK